MTEVQLDIVSDFEQLTGLKEQWAAVVNASPLSTIFHTPEWLLTWWKHFGSGELRILAFREGSRLAAIVPCFRHIWEDRYQLTLLGSGISDYLEPVIAAEHRTDVLQLLSAYLQNTLDWGVCNWQDLASPTSLAELDAQGLCIQIHGDTPCSEILINGDWDGFCRTRPRGLRRNLRRYADKARLVADFRFFAEPGFQSQLLETLIRLHSARWNRHGEAGMIAANRSANFLREAVPRLAAQGQALFFGLEFQGRTVAVILSFPYKNVLFSYLSGFDPEYEQYGFGKLLLYKSLEYAFANEFKSWNFLRGNEPYKFDWGATLVPKSRLIISYNSR